MTETGTLLNAGDSPPRGFRKLVLPSGKREKGYIPRVYIEENGKGFYERIRAAMEANRDIFAESNLNFPGRAPDMIEFVPIENQGIRDSVFAYKVYMVYNQGEGDVSVEQRYPVFMKTYAQEVHGGARKKIRRARLRFEKEAAVFRFENSYRFSGRPLYFMSDELVEEGGNILVAVMELVEGEDVHVVLNKCSNDIQAHRKDLADARRTGLLIEPQRIEKEGMLEELVLQRKGMLTSMLEIVNEHSLEGTRYLLDPQYPVERDLARKLKSEVRNEKDWVRHWKREIRKRVDAALTWEVVQNQGVDAGPFLEKLEREGGGAMVRTPGGMKIKGTAFAQLVDRYASLLDGWLVPLLVDSRYRFFIHGDEGPHNWMRHTKNPELGDTEMKMVLLDGDSARYGRLEESRARILLSPYAGLDDDEIREHLFAAWSDEKNYTGPKIPDVRAEGTKLREFDELGVYVLLESLGRSAKYGLSSRRFGVEPKKVEQDEIQRVNNPYDTVPRLRGALKGRLNTLLNARYEIPRETRERIKKLQEVNERMPYRLF